MTLQEIANRIAGKCAELLAGSNEHVDFAISEIRYRIVRKGDDLSPTIALRCY
jgi:hypothetical protein